MQVSKEELVAALRRRGKGGHNFSSKFRGVTRHQKGKWEARIGQACSASVAQLCIGDVCTCHEGCECHVLLSQWAAMLAGRVCSCALHRLLACLLGKSDTWHICILSDFRAPRCSGCRCKARSTSTWACFRRRQRRRARTTAPPWPPRALRPPPIMTLATTPISLVRAFAGAGFGGVCAAQTETGGIRRLFRLAASQEKPTPCPPTELIGRGSNNSQPQQGQYLHTNCRADAQNGLHSIAKAAAQVDCTSHEHRATGSSGPDNAFVIEAHACFASRPPASVHANHNTVVCSTKPGKV